MGFRKEHKTLEEKEQLLAAAIAFFTFLVREGAQGNITFPLYDGIVGKAKLDLYVNPMKANELFKVGGAS